VTVSGGTLGEAYSLRFAAPSGSTLGPNGVYTRAQRLTGREAGRPGIDISGGSRACNTQAGQFEVTEIAPDLSRLWIVYEQHCEGGSRARCSGSVPLASREASEDDQADHREHDPEPEAPEDRDHDAGDHEHTPEPDPSERAIRIRHHGHAPFDTSTAGCRGLSRRRRRETEDRAAADVATAHRRSPVSRASPVAGL
jgi:hypothetical protein